MRRYFNIGCAKRVMGVLPAVLMLSPATAFALGEPADGDAVECIVPDSDMSRSGQVVEVLPEGLLIDFGGGNTATLPAWLCSKRSTAAPGPSATVPTPTVSAPPHTPVATPVATPVVEAWSADAGEEAAAQPRRNWHVGGRLGYAVYLRLLNAYAASTDPSRAFTQEVEDNKFFALDRQLIASAYVEAWSQRVDLDAGTSTLVGGGEADYERLGFKYTSRLWRMDDEFWLLGLYAYDRASLTKEVDRIVEVRRSSYRLQSHALGLAVEWAPERLASEQSDAVSGSFNRMFVGVSVVKFRNEVEREREELGTGATESSVRWFESDGIWPVMTVGVDRSFVGSAGRFSFGLLGFHGLYVPMTSWKGDSHGWGNVVYEYTGFLDGVLALHDHVSLGVEARFVMYDNRFEVEGQDEAFHFKEMRAVGQALLEARY